MKSAIYFKSRFSERSRRARRMLPQKTTKILPIEKEGTMTTKHYFKIGASIISCVALVAIQQSASAAKANASAPVKLPELEAAAHITRDHWGIAHISARNDHDLFFLQGYVHAQDRLFQMDVSRRIASGTLAELVGEAALAQDVQLRTIGLHRAAERSLDVQSIRVKTALNAFAQGVNSFVQ